MCTDAEAITLMRALVARATGAPPTSPAVQAAADVALRLLPLLLTPPHWAGLLTVRWRRHGLAQIERYQIEDPP